MSRLQDPLLIAALADGLGPASVAWIRDGDGFVGHGVAHRMDPGTGPERFRRARELATAALAATTTSHLPTAAGTVAHETDVPTPGPVDGAIVVGSFTFDEEDEGSLLIVPSALTHHHGGMTRHITIAPQVAPSPSAERTAPAVTAPAAASPAAASAGAAEPRDRRPRFAGATVTDEAWLEAVQRVLDAIAAGEAEKVVLARDQHLWARAPFDLVEVVARLAERFPSCFTFLVDGLVGASPELLLQRRRQELTSLVLAGTAARSADTAEDARLGADLLASTKDREEHALALQSVHEVLTPLCSRIDIPAEPMLLRLANVQHLATPISATLAGPHHVLDLVGLLHPTAAVGGTPRARAIELIRANEGLGRRRYAGPVGWCDASGDGEWAIALRCAEIRGDRARLFAGAGLVAGSTPVDELRETWLKLGAMRGVLGALDSNRSD
jgi:menaquinone-specific isochorismate synthase